MENLFLARFRLDGKNAAASQFDFACFHAGAHIQAAFLAEKIGAMSQQVAGLNLAADEPGQSARAVTNVRTLFQNGDGQLRVETPGPARRRHSRGDSTDY